MTVLPGDIGLVTTSGTGSHLIRMGDAIYARREHTRHEPYNHAIIAVGNGLVVSGDPHGAALCSDHAWIRTDWRRLRRPLDDTARATLAKAARALVGIGYNWLDIAALTLAQLGWNAQRDDGKETMLGRRVNNDGRLICSQLVAKVYTDCGLPLFIDRTPGEVTPGDLARSPLFVPVT